MGWPKGKPRPEGAGRKPGTPNKKTQDLMDICEKKGVNVFEAMVELAIQETNKDKRFDRFKEIAQYLYPKRKAVEHSGSEEGFIIKIMDYTKKE